MQTSQASSVVIDSITAIIALVHASDDKKICCLTDTAAETRKEKHNALQVIYAVLRILRMVRRCTW